MLTDELQKAIDAASAVFKEMVKLLVEHPDEVEIKVEFVPDRPEVVRFISYQNKNDVKRLIGKAGKNAQALRRWLTAVGARCDRQFMFDIDEPYKQ